MIRNFTSERTLSENHGCTQCDLGDEILAEIERLRAVLLQIASENTSPNGEMARRCIEAARQALAQ